MKDLLDMVWSEKYRPNTLDDCVLPESTKKIFAQILEDGELPNLLFYSKNSGVGKTTIAKILAESLGYDVLEINGSSDRNIDTLRNEITSFCTAFSFNNTRKIVLIDEADYLNPTSTQPALRNFIQEFSGACSFIFTCNYVNKLIPALRSRFSQICFDFDPIDRPPIIFGMAERACWILDQEGVEYKKKVVGYYIKNNYPDFRKAINELQKASKSGDINSVTTSLKDEKDSLLSIIKERKFKSMRTWVAENHTLGMSWVADKVYDNLDELFNPEDQPNVITIVHKYAFEDTFSVNTEICIAACLSEIFLTC